MKSFDEVLSDINQLKGIELSSLSGTAKKIKVAQDDFREKRINLSVEGGSADTRSFEEIGKIYRFNGGKMIWRCIIQRIIN